MTLHSVVDPVDLEIRKLIQRHGRITFAQFMHTCLYSPQGGFYSSRSQEISAHFGTSSMTHPAFGALIARQLEQMWHLLGDPRVFHVIEVGSGEGSLARSIAHACSRMASGFGDALCYVAADYAPLWPAASLRSVDRVHADGMASSAGTAHKIPIHRVKTEGLRSFRNAVGCILSNELVDNFPVHRFAIQDGKLKEIYVTTVEGKLTEVLDEPSTPRIGERLTGLGLELHEGQRGEVSLALEDWTRQVVVALDRGFVLTFDYGRQADDLYSLAHSEGTLVCYHRHIAGNDPYQHIGQQDITCQVDFTSLMRIGERHGLAAVGYVPQRRFLESLGFDSCLDDLEAQDLSEARKALGRMAMMALVDPQEYGDLQVLAQAKGEGLNVELIGFAGSKLM